MAKQLHKLDHQHQVTIRDGVETLKTMPACQNVKALTNHRHGYRLRIGNYRVLFNWDGAIKVVEIEEVRNAMNMPTNIQIINGPSGEPAFVVIPYTDYVASRNTEKSMIPHDVISRSVDAPHRSAPGGHLGLTQPTWPSGWASVNPPMRNRKAAVGYARQAARKLPPRWALKRRNWTFEASRKDAQPNRSCVRLMAGVMNLRIHGVRVERELPLIP